LWYNIVVQSNKTQRIGVLDALATGLSQTSRQPWLLLIPVTVDLVIWLAPPLLVNELIRRFLFLWEALVRASYPSGSGQSAAVQNMLTGVREVVTQAGAQINLTEMLTGSWLSAPSALATAQSTRQTFISEMILAPVGLTMKLPHIAAAPWQPAPIEVASFWTALLIVLALWLAGQLLVALYVYWATAGWPANKGKEAATDARPRPNRVREFLKLAAQLMLFSVLLGVAVFFLRLPLGAALTLVMLPGGGGAVSALLFAAVGGITLWALLWFLTSLFFVSEALLLGNQPLWRSMLQSLAMVRGQGLRTLGLILLINFLMVGFRAVWGLMGQTPGGAVVAIVANAYLATSMLLAIFAYYQDLHRSWQARRAQAKSDWEKQIRMRE
jgi:hypothetical protein